MNDKELMNTIDKIQTELNNIKKELEVNAEPTFSRVAKGERYYSAVLINENCETTSCIERGDNCDNSRFANNNYFCTRERAQEVADKINMLLLLERLHDTYCPNYKPNWVNAATAKYFLRFIRATNRWEVAECWQKDTAFVYFPTPEIARKVCNILNA